MARIAINTRFLLKDKLEGFGWYSYEVARRLVQNHPEHEFFFFFDRPFDSSFVFGKNVHPIVLDPPARHPFLHVIWYEQSIKKALKKYKIDVFFSPDGYLSLGSKVPQVITIHDLNFEHYPEDLPWLVRKYYKYYFPKFAKRANRILTVSEFSRKDIIKQYQISEEKITAVWNGVSENFVPLAQETKTKIQHKYSVGEPYFLFVGSLHPRKNLQRLIEAYSLYCQSNENPWHLVIVGVKMWKNQANVITIPEEIRTNIHFTGRLNAEDLPKVVGAASTLAFVPYFEGFGIPIVEAMRCCIPVLSGNLSSLPEVGGDAVLYCDPFDVNSIKEGLVKISSDTKLADELAQKGLKHSQNFSWDSTAQAVWKEIESLLP